MPLPLVELNLSAMAWSAAAFAPVWVCQSTSAMGEPDSSMSAWLGWPGAGVADPLHAVATTMIAARIATLNRMKRPPLPLGPRRVLPRRSTWIYAGELPADTRPRHPLDEIPLREQEDQDDRGDHEGRRRHLEMILRPEFGAELGHSDLDRSDRVAVRYQERPLEAVVDAKAGDERHRHQHGDGEGEHDGPEEPEVPRAVDLGRVRQLVRDRQEVLAQQEDGEHRGQERDDLDLQRVAEAQVLRHEHEIRDERRLTGDHVRREQDHEHGALALEREPRESVRREDRGHEL